MNEFAGVGVDWPVDDTPIAMTAIRVDDGLPNGASFASGFQRIDHDHVRTPASVTVALDVWPMRRHEPPANGRAQNSTRLYGFWNVPVGPLA